MLSTMNLPVRSSPLQKDTVTAPLRALPQRTTSTLIDPWVVLRTGQPKAYLEALSKRCKPTNLFYRDDALQLLLWP
jgi:hypothetical protein